MVDSVVLEGLFLLWTVLACEAADSVWVHLDTTDWGGVWGSSEHPTKNKHIKYNQQCVNVIFTLDQSDINTLLSTKIMKNLALGYNLESTTFFKGMSDMKAHLQTSGLCLRPQRGLFLTAAPPSVFPVLLWGWRRKITCEIYVHALYSPH